MKRLIPVFTGVLLLFLISTPLPGGELKTVTLRVEGMSCALCAPSIRIALERVPGVKKAEVIYKEKKAIVKYDEDMAK